MLIVAALPSEGYKLDLYTQEFQSGRLATGEAFVLKFIIEIIF
jgi:hypothetical protein